MAAKQQAPDLAPDLDLELNQILNLKEDLHHSLASGGSMRESLSYAARTPAPRQPEDESRLRRWAESFRRDPKGRMTPKNAFVGAAGRNYFDLRAANYRTAHPLLSKELKGRHLQMIAIGGSIGECAPALCPNCVCVAFTGTADRGSISHELPCLLNPFHEYKRTGGVSVHASHLP